MRLFRLFAVALVVVSIVLFSSGCAGSRSMIEVGASYSDDRPVFYSSLKISLNN
jgi:hypothetical protein